MHLEIEWTVTMRRNDVWIMERDCLITIDCNIDCQTLVEWGIESFRFDQSYTAYEPVDASSLAIRPVKRIAYATVDKASDPALFKLLDAVFDEKDEKARLLDKICDVLLAEGHISSLQVAA